ncbi:hypothetical protein SAMN05660841_04097 [Sphingobacterium nematocida]|uniref:Virulence factor SrfB n=1 Tax=Sphingobacterium nematocida TaxID=1513896 RepID=A0A1T5GI83_9SPHI|nr:virulence factor SrfB [Sphingobacterium nematocida]SKC08133.1 hypothetical protein SAMN05660841_04097 [Sphingobacterium nematocida]
MKRISLIANSNIQYYKYEVSIDLSFGKTNRIFYHQPYDKNVLSFILDPLFKVNEQGEEKYYRREELEINEFLINNRLKDEVDLSSCTQIFDCFEESNLKRVLKNYQNCWIPIPYFKDNSINKDVLYPTDWVRVYITCDENFNKASIVVAVDTTLARNDQDKTSPTLSLNPDENIFRLESKEMNIARMIYSNKSTNAWIDKYLADLYYGKNDERRYEQPFKEYLGSYILLIKWLSFHPDFPEVQLFTDGVRKKTVDLVVDIGNSATCALLFESKDDSTFEFDSVKKLIIQDYSQPHLEYEKPFPMNVVFADSKFGNVSKDIYHNNKFIIPSMVRIGYEAEELINNSMLNLDLGYELKTYNSSPKRYLWDNSPSEREWEYHPYTRSRSVEKVYLNGISEQLNTDGSLVDEGGFFGSKSLFSKGSLMKFVFLELLIHAHTQINSFKFREEHGEMTVPRSIRRITISCPTGMIQYEQIALRKAAEEACILLANYQKFYFDQDENSNWFTIPDIIPSIKDISKRISQLESRQDWSYDEATCSQLVFVYSLLAKKLKGNNYVIDHFLFNRKSQLRIGSIDIGAGTTDLMINEYLLNEELTLQRFEPKPLFWDSFKLAGDDLLKELVLKILIKGSSSEMSGMGILERYALEKGIEDVQNKLSGFFGENTNNMGYAAKMMRKAFIHQVAIPIIYKCLELANTESEIQSTFEDITGVKFKNKELVAYFEQHFGFSFLDVKLTLSSATVNTIVRAVFDRMVRQIAVVLNYYECDFVVLSGKPASLSSFESLFKQYLSCSPNNVINLNNYWIGKWYPFADPTGVINDPKTIVSVGAIIALMSGKLNKLQDFKLNTTSLSQAIDSTADYVVKLNGNIKEEILSLKVNDRSFLVKQLPFQFGHSKFISRNYPYSSLYNLHINLQEIENIIRHRYPDRDVSFYKEQVNIERGNILQNMPLTVSFSRDIDESKEIVRITQVENANGNSLSTKYFSLTYQTLEHVEGYWLDTCEFVL